MNTNEYNEIVQAIIDLIDADKTEDAGQAIKQLSAYLPTGLGLYYAKAKLSYKKDKNPQAVIDQLEGKYTLTVGEYPFLPECLALLAEVSRAQNTPFETAKYDYLLKTICNRETSPLLFVSNQPVDGDDMQHQLDFLLERYTVQDDLGYLLQYKYLQKSYPDWDGTDEYQSVSQQTNIGTFLEDLDQSQVFVLFESEDSAYTGRIRDILLSLGKQVIYITSPLLYQANGIQIKDITLISLENIEKTDNMMTFHPIRVTASDASEQDNTIYLLEHILKHYAEDGLLHILCSGYQMDSLAEDAFARKKMSRLTPWNGDYREHNLAYGWYGDYLTYISGIYQEDCHALVDAKPTKRFSIVVPARNSSLTLRHTLRTCLEQRYTGDYEIIVSDNSTNQNPAVYELCKELNDPRIVYLKTPRDLSLAKSFEFAFLHTSGEYVFSIGSDDGVLPWALSVLDAAANAAPREEIFQWERGFYAWPGFNYGQQNQFTILRKYDSSSIIFAPEESRNYIDRCLKAPQSMYALPLLYINSCFKRSYLKTLLDKTGRLWDGICQDIDMGVINVCINSRIQTILYPLTIAGMSSGSMGSVSNKGSRSDEALKKTLKATLTTSNMGSYCSTKLERLVAVTYDVGGLYRSLLRAISHGLLPEQYLTEKFDWKKIYNELAHCMNFHEVSFEIKLLELRHAAKQRGEEFLNWFDESILAWGGRHIIIDEERENALRNRRLYECGTNEVGGVTLDASEYGVANIYEAVKLFEKLSGL